MFYIQKFHRHTKNIPNVWTPTLKIYCTVVLLRSHITAVSPAVERHSVSILLSLTSAPYHQLERVLKSFIIFSELCRHYIAYASIMKGPWNTGTTRRRIHHFWSIQESSRSWWKLLWEHAALPKTLTSGIFQTFHSLYLTTKHHHINIRITTDFKFSTSDVRCSPDISI